jgi:GrpB-like predicted nucleotidyltransferase (UPF0157 family)
VEAHVVETIVQQHADAVARLVPGSETHLTGSASIPGLDARDVDLVVLVNDVAEAADALRADYPPLYEAHWKDDWAAFRVPGQPQVDLYLTTRGSHWDAVHRLVWYLLRDDDALLAEYVESKSDVERKGQFFERMVGQSGQRLARYT